jgi:predicted enzyme related to lactoylglutathione lyase
MSTPIVFFDIVGPDLDVLSRFYADVFGWQITPGPHFAGTSAIAPVPVRSPLPGTLRQEAAGAPRMPGLIYLGVPDVTATLTKIEAHGGDINAPRFEVPGVVVLGLFRDPAGNSMGLVEMDGDKPKIP